MSSEAEDDQVMVTEATLFNARQGVRAEFLSYLPTYTYLPYVRHGDGLQSARRVVPHVTQIL